MNRITIFLSHSSKDIDKVKKVRNILELLGFDPLIFYLKCLDDDSEALSDLLKKEIEARSLFLYCKSEASEESRWVQEELKYIKSFDNKRLYTIDMSALEKGMIEFLRRITHIIVENRILIYYDMKDYELAYRLQQYLLSKDFSVSMMENKTESFEILGMSVFEYEREKNHIKKQVEDIVENLCSSYANEAILLPVITDNLYSSDRNNWAKMYKVARLIHEYKSQGGMILPLLSCEQLNSGFENYCIYKNDNTSFEQLYSILRIITDKRKNISI